MPLLSGWNDTAWAPRLLVLVPRSARKRSSPRTAANARAWLRGDSPCSASATTCARTSGSASFPGARTPRATAKRVNTARSRAYASIVFRASPFSVAA